LSLQSFMKKSNCYCVGGIAFFSLCDYIILMVWK
jgi:hypothetical protein